METPGEAPPAQPEPTQESMPNPEETDGIRWSWSAYPATRLEGARMVVPLACLYTPLNRHENLPVLPYDPVRCKNCGGVLNPYCRVDFRSKLWVCPFCFVRNAFPPQYTDISETNLPAELYGQFTTIEYVLSHQKSRPPLFFFVVDTCLLPSELKALKEALLQALSILPDSAYVGLLTFGTNVQVYDLSFEECAKSYILRGSKDYKLQEVQELLGIVPTRGPSDDMSSCRFIQPISSCLFTLESIIEDLSCDPWPVSRDSRPQRCTGAAISVAVSVTESLYKNNPAHIMSFIGGACTIGPGQVVTVDKTTNMRSHTDIQKGNAKFVKPALKFFDALGTRATTNGHVLDVFACCLDQVGLYELRTAVNQTGGFIFLSELFESTKFGKTLQNALDRDSEGTMHMCFNASLEVQTSQEWKVSGAIGPTSSLSKKSNSVSEVVVGVGGTSAWRINSITPQTTIGIYFDVVAQHAEQLTPGQIGYVQFTTVYHMSSGQTRLRVTTLGRSWAADSSVPDLRSCFDQEAAAVLLARMAVYRSFVEDAFDVVRWIDRALIRVVQKFGDYRKDDPASLRMSPEFSIFPQFIFHLRRCALLQVFNSSPDETALYREVFFRENCTNCMKIIQPTLLSYSLTDPPMPALLDATSVLPDHVLILDSFFEVVVFIGETIASWREAGYHMKEEYKNLKDLLEVPVTHARDIEKKRFPSPRFIICDQHSSESRLLMSRVNPSVTHQTMGSGVQGDVVFTEDVSLQVFMEHLRRLATQS